MRTVSSELADIVSEGRSAIDKFNFVSGVGGA